VLYQNADGKVTVNMTFARETFCLTQKAMAELFGVKVPAINKHLKNIFESGELVEPSVVSILETTAADGKSYAGQYYNLDAVIAVGYRVNSLKATHFRIWATNALREFIIKGFRPQRVIAGNGAWLDGTGLGGQAGDSRPRGGSGYLPAGRRRELPIMVNSSSQWDLNSSRPHCIVTARVDPSLHRHIMRREEYFAPPTAKSMVIAPMRQWFTSSMSGWKSWTVQV
jgi:hypothetical protein